MSPQCWDKGREVGGRGRGGERGRGRRERVGLSFLLRAGALTQVCALAGRLLFLPLAHGVGVAHNHFVHPGEGLGEEHRALEEAQVASV